MYLKKKRIQLTLEKREKYYCFRVRIFPVILEKSEFQSSDKKSYKKKDKGECHTVLQGIRYCLKYLIQHRFHFKVVKICIRIFKYRLWKFGDFHENLQGLLKKWKEGIML